MAAPIIPILKKIAVALASDKKGRNWLLGILAGVLLLIMYQDELETNEPETDEMGNIIGEYGERFLYVNKDLKKIVKMKANAISNMVKHQGIEVSPFYVENELFQMLKCYGYTGER